MSGWKTPAGHVVRVGDQVELTRQATIRTRATAILLDNGRVGYRLTEPPMADLFPDWAIIGVELIEAATPCTFTLSGSALVVGRPTQWPCRLAGGHDGPHRIRVLTDDRGYVDLTVTETPAWTGKPIGTVQG